MLLVLFALLQMRDEGVEDGMTGYGAGCEESLPTHSISCHHCDIDRWTVFTANVML